MDSIIYWLKKYGIILTFIISGSVAWADATNKINTIEQAVKVTTENQQDISKLKAGQERLDERTLHMQKAQDRQEHLLEMILQSQESLAKAIRK